MEYICTMILASKLIFYWPRAMAWSFFVSGCRMNWYVIEFCFLIYTLYISHVFLYYINGERASLSLLTGY